MDANTVSSKDAILEKIRNGKLHLQRLPDVPIFAYTGDMQEGFIEHLTGFDGKAECFDTRAQAIEWLDKQLDKDTKCIYSNIPEYQGTITLADLKDPHDAHKIDICIGEGELGVAETGSVWVTNKSLGLAAAALLSTDLYLLLDRANLKGGLHEAYQALKLTDTQYGSFYTGPSATADIEAIHVTGAQGEISLTVLLYGEIGNASQREDK